MKRTIVLGASNNPERYSYLAVHMLKNKGHEPIPVGIKNGEVAGYPILNLKERPAFDDVDTITVYMNSRNQQDWHDYILSLAPKRIIFNPGAENYKLEELASSQGITTIHGCTLVMLSSNLY